MPAYTEVKIKRILNPTAIDLGEYVINPYMGCEFSCLYCYVRFNKAVSKTTRPWGSYVDIRTNAPQALAREIAAKRPGCVLLGSTTECFQPVEAKYKITQKILEVLNQYKVAYTILTRSPYIAEYIPLLKEGFCRKIYFTFNNMPAPLKAQLEPKSPPYEQRAQAIHKLLAQKIPVVPYFAPLLPWISDIREMFGKFAQADSVEFEGLNFRLGNIEELIKAIGSCYPDVRAGYERLRKEKAFYESFWSAVKKAIVKEAIKAKKNHHLYIHNFGAYFQNTYSGLRG